ncbi:T-cell receptor alpha chain V region CTL-L17 [Tupaia chinensis]|nr:T-cell receptor alpha chain V region CTL-L17 [Tupaia chinensis]
MLGRNRRDTSCCRAELVAAALLSETSPNLRSDTDSELRGIMGDAKTTQPTSVKSAEEEPVHLPCNHSTISGSEYIHWYRQAPQQAPEFVIRGLKNNETNGMASLVIAADRKFSILILPRVTLRDTAVYYCMGKGNSNSHLKRPLHKNEQKLKRGKRKVTEKEGERRVCSQELEQSPQSLIVQEGKEITITCNSSKTLYTLHWYRQKDAEGLSFLMMLRKSGEEEKSHEKMTFTLDEKKQRSSLHIAVTRLSHSGTYFCGAEAQ